MWTTVPFIQKSWSNCCGILFQAWFDTGFEFLVYEWSDCVFIYSILFIFKMFWMLHAASWILFFFWPECVLFHACTLPLFSYRCEEFPSSTIVSLPCTSIAGTCTTWQRIASSTMRDFTKHDFRTHIANLFYEKKKVTEGGKKIPSRFSKVKWIGFKDSRAVRRLRNYLYRSTPELYICRQGQSVLTTLFSRLDTH